MLVVASVNSLAITLAKVYDGAKSDDDISGRLPITMVTAIVSPSARPSASTHAPKMPTRAAGKTTFIAVSHFVDPSAIEASRKSRGIAAMTSREIAVTVGRIINAKMIPPVSRPTPRIGPEKSGVQPRTCCNAGPNVVRMNGESTNRPHKPYTTLGTAASSSIKNESGCPSHRGAKSARKTAAMIPMNAARTIAISEVMTVPKIIGSAPNLLVIGSQELLKINPGPNLTIDGHDPSTSSTKSPTISSANRMLPA